MHSFQPSRGRIFFEVLCAVGIAASCGGAWMQTGASALLAAAGVSTLYALVHFFDLFRRVPSVAVEPQRIPFEPEPEIEVPVRQDVGAQLATIEERLTARMVVEEAPVAELAIEQVPASEDRTPVEPAAREVAESPRTKAPRKASGRRSATSKKAKTPDPAPVEVDADDYVFRIQPFEAEQPDAAEPTAMGEPLQTPVPIQAITPPPADEPAHPPVAPLFEPEPFFRQQQRAKFGRKAG